MLVLLFVLENVNCVYVPVKLLLKAVQAVVADEVGTAILVKVCEYVMGVVSAAALGSFTASNEIARSPITTRILEIPRA